MAGVKRTLVAFLVAALYGCGGGSSGDGNGDAPPPPSDASATGIWEGVISIDGSGMHEVAGIIYGDELRFISIDANAIYEGTLSVDGDQFTASTQNYDFDVGFFATSTLQGTVRTKESLSLTFTSSNSQSGTIDLTYDPITDRGSSLATISGVWSLTDPGGTLTIAVDSLGAVFGSDTTGCVYSGNIEILDAALNIYGFAIEVSSCGLSDDFYDGFAVLAEDEGAENSIMIFSLNSDASALVGVMERM